MKYFFKQYWRYIAMALAFATFNFLLNACEVKAETGIQTTNLGFGGISKSINQNIYRNNNNIFSNWGRTYVAFNLIVNNQTGGGIYPIKQISVTSTNNIFICKYGNTTIDYDDTQNGYIYDVICDVNIGAYGLQSIDITFDNYDSVNGVYVATSQYMTLYQNLDLNIAQVLQQQQAITQGYLNTIHSAIDLNGQYIVSAIQALQSQQITAINNNTQAVNGVNDSINNSNTDGGQTQANDFFSNFNSGDTGSLMDLVSLPLDFLDSLNNACTPISITIPFINQTFQLPCLRSMLTNTFGGLVSIIVLVINALLCYRLIKGFIDIIHNLKDPTNDEIEVMDL